MKDIPGWLKWFAGVALATLVVALFKPPVAGLALRLLAVGIAAVLAVLAVRRAVGGLEPADGLGRKPDPRAPGELPRDLATLTDELRATHRRDNIPNRTLQVLRSAIQHRLWQHRRLSSTMPDDEATIRALLSDNAYILLRHAPSDPPPLIPASALPALIEEVEQL